MQENTRQSDKFLWVQALVVMTFLQAVLAFLIRALPVIGPEITVAAGAEPHDIGILAGAISVGTMLFLMGGNLTITFYGPVRILQIGAIVCAIAVSLCFTTSWWFFVVAAFFIGVGYAPSLPAASDLLLRTSPPGRQSLIMSIKQAGVPLGGALAGVLLPAIVIFGGWQAALLATAFLSIAGAVVVQPWRNMLDTDRNTTKRPTVGNVFARTNLTMPFLVLKEIPGLLPLTLAVVCFSCAQGCILTFFITQLTTELRFSLADAGIAYSAMQVAGTFSRVVMGWLADKLGSGKTLLLLALISTGMILALAQISSDCPTWLVTLTGFALGITSISWNGVYLAEVGRIAPKGRVGDATSGSSFFLFIAYSLGPFLFSFGVPLTGSYSLCFFAVALVQLLAVPALARCIRLTPQ